MYSRQRWEGRKSFDARQTCSREHSNLWRNALRLETLETYTKICKNPGCRKEFGRRISPNYTETPDKFEKRKTCSIECGHIVRQMTNGWAKKGSGGGGKSTRKSKSTSSSTDSPPPPPSLPVWRPSNPAFGDARPKKAV